MGPRSGPQYKPQLRLKIIVTDMQLIAPAKTPGSDELDLRDTFELLGSGRRTVLVVAAAVFLLALAIGLAIEPRFQSSGSLQISDNNQAGSGLAGVDLATLAGGSGPNATEVQLLQSRLVLNPVIDKLNLDILVQPDHFPLIGASLARHNAAGNPGLADAFPGFGRWAWGGEQLSIDTLDVPDNWLNSAITLVVEANNAFTLNDFWGNQLVRGRVGVESSSSDGQFRILVSSMRARPGTRFTVTRYPQVDAVQNVLDNLEVQELSTSSGVISISYTSPSSRLAAAVVNALMESYLAQDAETHAAIAKQKWEYLSKQFPKLEEDLKATATRLADYQRENGSPDVDGEAKILLQNSTQLNMKQLDLQTELAETRQSFGPQSTEVRKLIQAIASVENEQQQLNARLAVLPAQQQQVQLLTREVENLAKLNESVRSSIHGYALAEAGNVASVRIVDSASEPFVSAFPPVTLILVLSIPLGIVAGMMFVLAQRALLRGLDDPREAERTSGVPMVSIVPFARQQKVLLRRSRQNGEASPVLAEAEPYAPSVEVLRMFSEKIQSGITMLCGPAPDVGKSFVVANLGVVIAQAGRSTLLVDADLRGGRLHSYFGSGAAPGITDYVLESAPLEAVIRQSDIKGLDYIGCGEQQPGSVSILRHPRFAELMSMLATKYDTILVTAPAVLAAPDASIVGQFAGATFLVLGSSQHRPSEIQDAIKRLAAEGVAVSGLLMNRVGENAGSLGYRGYGTVSYEYG